MSDLSASEFVEAETFVPYGVLGYINPIESHEAASIEQINTYLRKAGYVDISHVPPLLIYATELKWGSDVFPKLKAQLEKWGFRVTIITESLRDHLARIQKGSVDIALVNIRLNQPETYHLLEYFKCNHPLHPFNTCDATFDALLEKSQLISDRMQRGEVYHQANEYMYDHMWTINLFHQIRAKSYIRKGFVLPHINYLGPEFMRIRDVRVENTPL